MGDYNYVTLLPGIVCSAMIVLMALGFNMKEFNRSGREEYLDIFRFKNPSFWSIAFVIYNVCCLLSVIFLIFFLPRINFI